MKEITEEQQLKEIQMLATGKCYDGMTRKQKETICWWKDNFPFEVIEFACRYTLDALGKPSYTYANALLRSWKERGVKTRQDAIDICEQQRKAFLSRFKG